jgi:hypothetical protein
MPKWTAEDEEDDDREDPDLADMDDAESNDEVDTVECPFCGKPVYEQAELCPHCHNYISREDPAARPPRRGWVIWVGVITCLSVLAWWIYHGLNAG